MMILITSLFSAIAALLYSFLVGPRLPQSPGHHPSDVSQSHKALLPLTFKPLPLGSIHATEDSWLEHELQNSASGLAGHLFDFYAFVKDSSWLGGDPYPGRGEYSRLNEGFPYWFNGLVALAYTLDGNSSAESRRLRAQVDSAANQTISVSEQSSDGWLGPESKDWRVLWGRFPFLLGLTALSEANATAWEKRIMQALWRFVKLMHEMLSDGGKGYRHQGDTDKLRPKSYSYGMVRMADMMITLQWLLEKDPDIGRQRMLWECMEMLQNQNSLKWEDWYKKGVYIPGDLSKRRDEAAKINQAWLHGVNVAQGLKTPAVIQRFKGNDASLQQTAFRAVDWTFEFHGAASGTILGDEHLTGVSPYTGSELCTTVETIFSLVYLYHALGRNDDADRAELATYNALPSMLTGDHWAHQYLTQPNQAWSKNLSRSPFKDTNSQSQTFGLEPHYPCCTVNHPQGLPKFIAGSWARLGDNGLAHLLLSPGTVEVDGRRIQCHTKYPFEETFEYQITTEEKFNLYVRVPEWAKDCRVSSQDVKEIPKFASRDSKTGLLKIPIPAGNITVQYSLNASIRIQPRENDTVAIYRGPLLYALEIDYEAQRGPPKSYKNQTKLPESYTALFNQSLFDWVLTNKSPWNIAIEPSTLEFKRRDESELQDPIWAKGGPPVWMTVRGCEIKNWQLHLGSVPGPPPPWNERQCSSNIDNVRLVPIGSAKLHMAELPTIDLKNTRYKT